MSRIVVSGNTSGSGTVTLQAPSINSDYTLMLPNVNGTLNSLTLGTAVSASGTSVEFANIPSWAKRITVMFSGVSTNGTSNIIIQLGTGSTTYTTSGYLGATTTSTGGTIVNFSTGFMVSGSTTATTVFHGQAVITNLSSNIWTESGILGLSDQTNTRVSGGSVSLTAALTALRITTVNGTDTFDAGTINILYE